MSAQDTSEPSSPDRPEPIAYAATANVVSVRGFRLLIALTVLNTALLGWYVIGPQLIGFAKSQWNSYQQRKAERAQLAAQAASREAAMVAEARAMEYAARPGTLVYDDDPARRDPAASEGTPIAPWPAVTPRPAEADALPAEWVGQSSVVLFMHERKASASSSPLLVIVTSHPRTDLQGYLLRQLWSTSVRPTTAEDDAVREETSILDFMLPEDASLRLFAGEADEADLSRFIIPYELAGERGNIHGQLQGDGSVRLTPDGPLLEFWPNQRVRRARQPD